MAIFHFHAQLITRSAGRSCVAAAAYRSGQRLFDERQGLTFDYRRKREVVYRGIMAPINAPSWVTNRARLWGEVEQAEKRIDSQLARELDIALPVELTHEEHVRLIRQFSDEQFVSRGMVVDISIHDPKGNPNPHVHVLMTLRHCDSQGFSKLKARGWNDKALLEEWRSCWASTVNKTLRNKLGSDAPQIDHRTLLAQGIVDREPTSHLGPNRNAIQKKRMQDRSRSSSNKRSTSTNLTITNEEKFMSETEIGNTKVSTAVPVAPALQEKIANNRAGAYRPSLRPASTDVHADRKKSQKGDKMKSLKISEFILSPFIPGDMTPYRSPYGIGTKQCEALLFQTFPGAEITWKHQTDAYYYEVRFGKVLLRDYGASVRCNSNEPESVKALVRLAKAKGWPGIRLQGDENFLRAAWIEAVSQGYAPASLSGYTPNADDLKQAQAAHALVTLSSYEPPPKPSPPDQSASGDGQQAASITSTPSSNSKGGLTI